MKLSGKSQLRRRRAVARKFQLRRGTTYQYRVIPYGRISRGGASIYFPHDEGNIENHTGLHTACPQRAELPVGRRNGDDEDLLIGAAAGRRRVR